MKLSEDERVFLRQLAKKASKEIHQRWKEAGVTGQSTSEAAGVRDRISRDVLQKTKPLLRPSMNFYQLLFYIGVVNGRTKDPD